MIVDMSYWTRVIKRIIYILFILIGLYLIFKLSIFYMPFLVAFIISLIIEPLIRIMMKKMKMTRKMSSIIIFILVSLIILGSLTWGVVTLFSEASSLLGSLNQYIDKAYILFRDVTNSFDFDKIHFSNEIVSVLQNSTEGILSTISNWAKNILTRSY